MDWFDDIQVEELENFDFIEEDISELVEEKNNFNLNEYLNSNIDYWQFPNCPLNHPHWPFILYYSQMTENIPNVLHHIRDLKDAWRRQDFTFTKQQQEEYDLLLATRRERVKQFYAEDRVCKVSKSAQDKLKDADI